MQNGILDREIIQGLLDLENDGSPGLLGELLVLLQDSAPAGFQAIEDGLAKGDAAAVSGAAHSLKSSFANLGAMEMSKLCLEIESGARRGDLTPVPAALARLREGFPEVERSLQQLIERKA